MPTITVYETSEWVQSLTWKHTIENTITQKIVEVSEGVFELIMKGSFEKSEAQMRKILWSYGDIDNNHF